MKAYKLIPTCKDYIWGGAKLKREWNKISESDTIAETWELSCHNDGASRLAETGETLKEFLARNPEYIGEKAKNYDMFPILIKLIDSQTPLSIQVHPSDDYALRNEGQYGKTEMWYVVSCEKGAGVYCGFKSPLTLDEVRVRLDNGTICDALNFVEVKEGDTLFIEAGTVHAICGGLVICEVQQNSSLTYRLFDYDRQDANGNKRELHIDKAMAVINSKITVVANETVENITKSYKLLAKCKYFTTYEISGKNYKGNATGESFTALNFLNDAILEYYNDDTDNVERMNCLKGDTVFVPARLGEYSIIGDDIKVIKTTL